MNHKPTINNLRMFRKKSGFTQHEVALKLGLIMSNNRISKWEQVIMYPHVVNLFKLAALYKVMPHELYEDFFEELTQEDSKLI